MITFNRQNRQLLNRALEYHDAGISVIPLRLDGSKSPVFKFKQFLKRLPTREEIEWMFSRIKCGIGIIGGEVSGGLEIFDFDDGSLFEPWRRKVEHIVCRLPVIETPSGGKHIPFRCDEVGHNTKIACDPSKPDKKTLIETRGEDGYVCGVDSPAGIHDQGLYIQVEGPPLPEIPRITVEERKQLWAAARSFDKGDTIAEAIREKAKALRSALLPATSDEGTPWGDFNSKASWHDVLTPAGWTTIDGIVWSRPGQEGRKSGQVWIAKNGNEVLVVFSKNSGALAPIGQYKKWSKFNAWAELYFKGDKRAAAREARELGYGDRRS